MTFNKHPYYLPCLVLNHLRTPWHENAISFWSYLSNPIASNSVQCSVRLLSMLFLQFCDLIWENGMYFGEGLMCRWFKKGKKTNFQREISFLNGRNVAISRFQYANEPKINCAVRCLTCTVSFNGHSCPSYLNCLIIIVSIWWDSARFYS